MKKSRFNEGQIITAMTEAVREFPQLGPVHLAGPR
jgi:hypothetical protein